MRPVSTFILAGSIREAAYLMSERMLEKNRIVMRPPKDVRGVFDNDSAFARTIIRALSQCYRSVLKNTKDPKLCTSSERLANYILRQRARTTSDEFGLALENKRLGSYLGTTPESLSRACNGLEPYGVTVNGNSIKITDPDDLEHFAKPARSLMITLRKNMH